MDIYKKFSIRAPESTFEAAEEFAKTCGISRNAAIGILLKLGIQYLHQSDAHTERIDQLEARLEANLKGMQKANYKALVYLSTAAALDQPRQARAEASAIQNVTEIFGKEEEI
jgi:hypothetical protein